MTPETQHMLHGMMLQWLQTGTAPEPAAMDYGVYAWHMLRWESDTPLTDEQHTQLLDTLRAFDDPSVVFAAAFPNDAPDSLVLLLAYHQFPARAHRATSLWLRGHQLVERCNALLEQEGMLYVGEEFSDPSAWRAHPATLPAHDWWQAASPLDHAAAHQHRIGIQVLLKRRQHTALGGYVTRALRGDPEPGLTCFGLIPVIIEAIWSQYADLALSQLIEALDLPGMTRRPKEVLLDWLDEVSLLLRHQPEAASSAPIERVIAAINADCSLPYSQLNLSRSLGLTPAYFCRLFREQTGEHFSTFLTTRRMEKARMLLLQGGLSLQEVADACGYPNKSYFCQVFKRHTGMTPGEFEASGHSF